MLHQKRRGGDPIFLILSMVVLVALIGVIQIGLQEVRFGQDRFFMVSPSGQLREIGNPLIDNPFLGWGAEYGFSPYDPRVLNPPFTMTGDRRPTKFWAMGEYEEE